MGFLDKGFVGVVVIIIQTFYSDSPEGYVFYSFILQIFKPRPRTLENNEDFFSVDLMPSKV